MPSEKAIDTLTKELEDAYQRRADHSVYLRGIYLVLTIIAKLVVRKLGGGPGK